MNFSRLQNELAHFFFYFQFLNKKMDQKQIASTFGSNIINQLTYKFNPYIFIIQENKTIKTVYMHKILLSQFFRRIVLLLNCLQYIANSNSDQQGGLKKIIFCDYYILDKLLIELLFHLFYTFFCIIRKRFMRRDSKDKKKYEMKAPPSFENFKIKMQQQNRKFETRGRPNFPQQQRPTMPTRTTSQNPQKQPKLSRNQSGNTRRSVTQSAAQKKQYSRYLSNTKNVFYEDRSEIKSMQTYYTLRPLLNKMFTILFLAWLLLYFVKPFDGICPMNAECGVYVHCVQGFELRDGRCIVSKQTKQKASVLCLSVIENLKYEYGSTDCSDDKKRPSKNLPSLLQQYRTDVKAFQDQIYEWFRSRQNQEKYQFQFFGSTISPMQKKHTLFCKFQLIVESPSFYLYSVPIIIAFFAFLIFYRLYQQKQKAQKIYDYLKETLKKNKGDIIIDVTALQKKFGKVTFKIWQNVDRIRVQDRSIAYYQDRDLHWRLI